jgi:hypothetical protein
MNPNQISSAGLKPEWKQFVPSEDIQQRNTLELRHLSLTVWANPRNIFIQ